MSSVTASYDRDAARLYGLSILNRYDANLRVGREEQLPTGSEFVRWKLIYYVDASVLLPLVVWPGRYGGFEHYSEDRNRHFLSNIGDSTADDCVCEAVLAGELIFLNWSGREVSILPEHFSEWVAKVRDHVSSWPARSSLYKERERLNAKTPLAKHFVKICGEALQKIRGVDLRGDVLREEEFAKIVAEVERHPIMETLMMHRLRHLSPGDLPFRARFPKQAAVNRWHQLLLAAGKPERQALSDARSLAQIESLNEIEEERRSRVRHLLISGDSRLMSVYLSESISTFGGDPDIARGQDSAFLSRFFLRHPAQFVPTLNQHAFHSEQGPVDGSSLLDDVVRAAAANISRTNSDAEGAAFAGFSGVFSGAAERSHVVVKPENSVSDATDVRVKWARLMRLSALLNRAVISRRWTDGTEALSAKTGSSLERFKSILELQRKLLASIQSHHLRESARAAVRALFDEVYGRSLPVCRVETHLARAYTWGHTEVEGWAGVLDRFRSGDEGECERLDLLVQKGGVIEVERAFLLCGLLSQAINGWKNALWYFERALDSFRLEALRGDRDEDLTDLYFLLGRARRLNPGWVDFIFSYSALMNSLNLAKKIDSKPLRTRAEAELGALSLAQLMLSLARGMGLSDHSDVPAPSNEAIERAIDWLESASNFAGDTQLAVYVRKQALINLSILIIVSTIRSEVRAVVARKLSSAVEDVFTRAVAAWKISAAPLLARLYLLVIARLCPSVSAVLGYGYTNLEELIEQIRKESPFDYGYACVVAHAVGAHASSGVRWF